MRTSDGSGKTTSEVAEPIESLRRALAVAVARVCPSWMAQEREDLVQTALLKIASRIGGKATSEVNASYLWKTAYSVTLDEIRRARWRFERSMKDSALGDGRLDTGPDPERAASSREICLHVRACLQRLAASRRRAVLMRLAGYSHDSAAQRLGMTEKQIANYVHRGMQDLRRCLQAKGVTA